MNSQKEQEYKPEQKSCRKCFGSGVVLAYKIGVDEQPYAFACDSCYHKSAVNYPKWDNDRKKQFELRTF